MARDGAGTWIPLAPVVGGTIITSTWANNMQNSFGADITESLDRSGRGGMLVPFRIADGNKGEPGYSWTAELSTGFYRDLGGFDMRTSIGGVDIFRWNANGAQISPDDGATWEAVLTNGGVPGAVGVPIGTVEAQTLYWDEATDKQWKATSLLLTDAVNGRVTALKSSSGRAYAAAASTVFVVERSADSALSLIGGNINRGVINFGDTDLENIGQLAYDHLDNAMLFFTDSAERMRIDSAGNVGIGTDSPDADSRLTVSWVRNNVTGILVANTNVGSSAAARIAFGNDSDPLKGAEIGLNSSTSAVAARYATPNALYIKTISTGPIIFGQGNAERMRIDSAGNLGIGTNAPNADYRLTVQSATGGEVAFTNSAEAFKASVGFDNPSGLMFIHSDTNVPIVFTTGLDNLSTERMRIDSVGNVGIGTADPVSTLSLKTLATTASLPIPSEMNITAALTDGGTYGGGIGWASGDLSQNRAAMHPTEEGTGAATGLAFAVRNTSAVYGEAMRIDSAGNVGIGTASPTAHLHVREASAAISLQVTADGQDSRFQFVNAAGTTVGVIRYSLSVDEMRFNVGGEFSTQMTLDAAGLMIFANMPTSAPAASGALWSNGGVVNITP